MSSVRTKVAQEKGPEQDTFLAQRKRMNLIIAMALGLMVVVVATAGIWIRT